MTKITKGKCKSTWQTLRRGLFLILGFLMLNGMSVIGQNIVVKGTLTDAATNDPIPGVNVYIDGTQVGVITDIDGKYEIEAPANATLVYSFIGYKVQKIPLNGQTQINLKMESEFTALDEVVAIGYGTSKRKDLTGSVSSVKGEDLAQIPIANTAQALTGRLAGVQITSTDGSPDAEMIIRVRGGGSITQSTAPLYIVDGFPVSSINDIASTDIESIDVLKDASSTAIYGARGANGVVLITTKSAKEGKTQISYNGFMQTKRLARRLDVLDTYEYVMLNYELSAFDGSDGIKSFEKKFGVYEDLDLYKYVDPIDWQDDMFGSDVISEQHNININGGNDKTKFALSGTYNKDGGLMKNNDYSRYNINFKLDHEIAKNLMFKLNARVSDTEINGSGTSGGTYKIRTSQAVKSPATRGLQEWTEINPDLLTEDEYNDWVRSNLTLSEQAAQYWKRQNRRRYTLNASINWNIIDGLKYNLEGGIDRGFDEKKQYWGEYTTNASYVGGMPLVDWQKNNIVGKRVAQYLNYNFNLRGIHNLDVTLGQEIISDGGDNNYMKATMYSPDLSPERIFANMGLTEGTIEIKSNTNQKVNMSSYFGRVGYNLMDRYLATITLRRDGSSKFLPGSKQWGTFPSAAVAYRLSEEPFMSFARSWLSNLKLRASYGEAGNNRIGDGQYQSSYKVSTSKAYGIGDKANGYYELRNDELPNKSLTWESMITRNIGLDFGLFRERVSGTVEYYNNSSKNLLLEREINAPGYSSTFQNVGVLSNKGIEVTLNTYILQKKNLTINFSFNIGFNKSNVDDLGGLDQMEFQSGWAGTDLKGQEDYLLQVGKPIGLIYGFVTDGYYTTDDFESYDEVSGDYILKDGVPDNGILGGKIGVRPGTLKLKDLNHDGEITVEDDRTIIGSADPDFYGGFGFDATFKGFDLNLLFSYVYGNQIYNADKMASTQQLRTSYSNMLSIMDVNNRYTYLNRETGQLVTDLATLAEMNEGSNAKELWSPFSLGNATAIVHSWAIEDGSYLRLQNVTLGYTVPKKITRKIACERFRVYCTLNNVWLLTNYSGYDPEVSSPVRNDRTSNVTPGIDYSSYPKSFSYTFGVNITF